MLIELKKLHQEYKIEEEKKRIKFLNSSRQEIKKIINYPNHFNLSYYSNLYMSEENNAIFKQEWAYVEFYELVELIANDGIRHCKFQKIQNFDELYETQLNRFFELIGIK